MADFKPVNYDSLDQLGRYRFMFGNGGINGSFDMPGRQGTPFGQAIGGIGSPIASPMPMFPNFGHAGQDGQNPQQGDPSKWGDRFRLIKNVLDVANAANSMYQGYQGARMRSKMQHRAEKAASQNDALRERALQELDSADHPSQSADVALQPARYRRVVIGSQS